MTNLIRSILLPLFFVLVLLSTGCKETVPPTVTTADVIEITDTSARSGGVITSDGGSPITMRGICWGLGGLPDTTGFKTEDGTGAGEFISEMTGLSSLTQYYARAYAVNEAGISYGEARSFSTAAMLPAVTTGQISNLKSTSATVSGEVTADGGAAVTSRGICWGTSANPDINGQKVEDSSGTGEFAGVLSGLIPNTNYFARAFATNSSGTAYGDQITFKTPLYSIGQTHAGGIIFYIDNTGEHGLVAATADQSNSAYWGCAGVSVSTSLNVGTGNQNTINILAACSTPNIAARLCADLNLNGFQDWYLPSLNELILMYQNLHKAGLGNFNLDRNYWSSHEYNANLAHDYSFAWEYASATIKSGYPEYRLNVRAIRAF